MKIIFKLFLYAISFIIIVILIEIIESSIYLFLSNVRQHTSRDLCSGLPSLTAQLSPLLYSHTPRRLFPDPLIMILATNEFTENSEEIFLFDNSELLSMRFIF